MYTLKKVNSALSKYWVYTRATRSHCTNLIDFTNWPIKNTKRNGTVLVSNPLDILKEKTSYRDFIFAFKMLGYWNKDIQSNSELKMKQYATNTPISIDINRRREIDLFCNEHLLDLFAILLQIDGTSLNDEGKPHSKQKFLPFNK